jgi:diguanylate cyclase (GGDEF)-like protein/PAS domain S-box-containing protein
MLTGHGVAADHTSGEGIGRTDPELLSTAPHSNAFLAAALANSSDLLVVIDDAAKLTFVSAAAERILSRSPQDWIGRDVFELLHPDVAAAAAESLVTSMDSGTGVKDPIEVRVLHADGTWREVEIVANNLLHDPEVNGILINARDVSERQESRRRIDHANRRFELAFSRSPIGMALTTLDGRLVRVNQALADLVGHSPQDLLTMSIRDLVDDTDRDTMATALADVLQERCPSHSMEQRFRDAAGHRKWTRCTITVLRDEDDHAEHYLLQIEDIGERRRLLQELRRSALVDALTSLANRAGFAEFVERLSPSTPIGVLALDLDRFKRINDESGHGAGDAVLQEVARRIEGQVRRGDLVARMGGDEFVVVCVDIEPDQLMALGERIVDRIGEPIGLADGARFVGASAGAALGSAADSATVLHHADQASYRSKRSGGNTVAAAT